MLIGLFSILSFLYFFQPQEKQQKPIPVYDFAEFEHLLHQSSDTLYVLNFWATWCKPCVKELPYFDALERKFQGEKLKVILVSLDDRELLNKSIIPLLEKRNITSQVVVLDDARANDWIDKVDSSWSGAIPATLVYSNKLRYFYEQDFTEQELNQIIQQHINQNK